MSDVIEKPLALRGAAREVLKCRAPEVLLAGPAGTGKSYACLWKVHLMCLKTPGLRALVVRKTHVSLTETGLVTYKTHVAAEALATGLVRWYGGSGDKPAAYIYSNGSTIVVGGLDKPQKIMSSEYDVAYVQEATELTLTDWESITTRLRNGAISFQQLLADCNPQQPSHWLKKRCDEGMTVMLYGRHEDNPRLFDADGAVTVGGAEYISKLDNLTGVRKLRLRHGVWAAAEGIIYEEWRPELHLSDRKRLPLDWPRLWGVDFGFTNPFVWQQWAIDPDGRLWLEKEIYRSKTLVEDHAKVILDVVTRKGNSDPKRGEWLYPKPRAIICDHDAEDRATLERHLGMGTVAAWKSVSDGIQAVGVRMRPAGDGKPRLFVCRNSLVSRDEELAQAGKPLGAAQEVEGYVWAPGQDGKPVKEEPLKLDDHSMDTMRYVVAYQDLAPMPRVRWM